MFRRLGGVTGANNVERTFNVGNETNTLDVFHSIECIGMMQPLQLEGGLRGVSHRMLTAVHKSIGPFDVMMYDDH
jgi:hypothetical protein